VVSRCGTTRTTLTAGINEYRQRVPVLTTGKAGFGFHGLISRQDITAHPNLAPRVNFGILRRKRDISQRDTAKV
jgi:capsule polysaccharide modification protein KpsS